MPKKIVVVDDEEDLRFLMRTVLEECNYEVHTAANGLEGRQLIEKVNPDLVMLDLKMPKLNGYELTLQLKQNPRFKDLPIMILTSLTDSSRKTDADWRDSLEVTEFVSKPWDTEDLLRRVEKILGE